MEIENFDSYADKTLIYPRHPQSYEQIQFKLSEDNIQSPLHHRFQNSLTYTASMETVQDHFRFQDGCEPYSPDLASLAHQDIFIQGVRLQYPSPEKPAISLRLITDESQDFESIMGEINPPTPNKIDLEEEISKQQEEIIILNKDPSRDYEFSHNPQLFKKKSTLKINNIEYEGKVSPSEKSISTSNTVRHTNIKNPQKTVNKITMSKNLKRKYLKKQVPASKEKQQTGDPIPQVLRKKASTVFEKSSLKILNMLDSGSDFIEQENSSNKSHLSKRCRVVSVFDSLESERSCYGKKTGSISPHKMFCRRNNKISEGSEKHQFRNRGSSTIHQNRKNQSKIIPLILRKKQQEKNQPDLQVVATKVSLTERKTGRNSFHTIKNQRIKAKSDLFEAETAYRRETSDNNAAANPKKLEGCGEVVNFEMNPSLNMRVRENIYHRKVLYMR